MKTYLIFLIGCLMSGLAKSDNCLNYNINFNLNLKLLAGVWYPLIVDADYPWSLDCKKYEILLDPESSKFVTTINNVITNNTYNFESFPSKKINSFINIHDGRKSLSTVIDTDYDSFLVMIQCRVKITGNRYDVIILSRKSKLAEDVILRLKNLILKKFGNFSFKNVIHSTYHCHA